MIDLKKAVLPDAICVGGIYYKIKTSFKYWLRFVELSKTSTDPSDFLFMYEQAPDDLLLGHIELNKFCVPPRELPRGDSTSDVIILDYKLDADFIYSGFMQQYKIDLVESDMHWYKFRALLAGLRDTKLNDIMQFRAYENDTGKKDSYTRYMENKRAEWEIIDDTIDEDLQKFEKLLEG